MLASKGQALMEAEAEGEEAKPDPETLEAANEVLEDLFDASFADARNRELDAMRVPYVVDRYMQQFKTIIPLFFVSNDAGINGPDVDLDATDDPAKTAWDVEPTPSRPPLDYWSRGAVPWRKLTDRTAVMPAQKLGAPPPPLPVQRPSPTSSPGRAGLSRPQSAHNLARGRSYSAAGPLRPSSAAALRAGGSLEPSASQPALASRGVASCNGNGNGSTKGALGASASSVASGARGAAAAAAAEAGPRVAARSGGAAAASVAEPPKLARSASRGSLGGSSRSLAGASGGPSGAPEPEMTKNGYLICRGPEHLQPKFQAAERRRRLALETEPDPEQRKINALRATLLKERESAQAEIAQLEKRFAKSDFFYTALGEPVELTKPRYARMQPLRAEPFRGGISAVSRGLLIGQQLAPATAPAKKRRASGGAAGAAVAAAASKGKEVELTPEDQAKAQAAAERAAQAQLLSDARVAREANGKASYVPSGSRQPPLSETLRAAQGVRLVSHELTDDLGNTGPPKAAAPPKNRRPIIDAPKPKTKSAPELVAS